MSKYSRGSQLSSDQRQVTSEQRRRQIAERNRAAQKEKLRGIFKVCLLVFGALLLVFALVKLQFIRYDENKVSEPYRTSIASYFSDNPIKKSLLFFSPEDLNSYITQNHPEVSKFAVSTSWIAKTTFAVEKKKTSFHWQTSGRAYLGDDEGVIYEATKEAPADDILPLRDGSNLAAEVGDKVVPSSTLSYISDIDVLMGATGSKVDYYSIPQAAREVHMYLVGKPYFVKFSLDRTVAGQLAELQKATQFIDSSGTSVRQYIDLRTEDKAYYR